MAVDIDAFKRDLDQLKNQRSVLQAKLEESKRHVEELKTTLKGMGFNSVEEAKQAYVKQVAEAESQHALVKQFIAEIAQVDQNVPSKEEVANRLKSLSFGTAQFEQAVPQTDEVEVETGFSESTVDLNSANLKPAEPVNDFVQQQVIPPAVENVNSNVQPANNSVDLGGLLFANL